MTVRFAFSERSGTASDPVQRGSAPVGHLHELPALELAAVLYLRAWCDGGAARDQIASDFCLVLGGEAGTAASDSFDGLMRLFIGAARRPVMRHAPTCPCVGGDENVFASMLAPAATGDRDDATLFGCLLLTPGAAFVAVQVAGELGQVFLRIARAHGRNSGKPAPQGKWRH